MEKNWFDFVAEKNQIAAVMEVNAYTEKFHLTLSEEEAALLVQEQRACLKEQQRIEFGEGILKKLIFAFCDSDYIYQENYVASIERLQEIFYLYKNESMDEITDDELVNYMKSSFEHTCHGSLEYLEDTCLEEFARDIRKRTHKFIGRYAEDEE